MGDRNFQTLECVNRMTSGSADSFSELVLESSDPLVKHAAFNAWSDDSYDAPRAKRVRPLTGRSGRVRIGTVVRPVQTEGGNPARGSNHQDDVRDIISLAADIVHGVIGLAFQQ